MNSKKIARLILEDGSEFTGWAFGAHQPAAGEVVFNTAMTGYPESLTDPSFKGQLLVSTYPLIGNYGVPPYETNNPLASEFESEQVRINGLIIQDYSFKFSHWNARISLDEWLSREGVPGIYGLDTRALTRKIREKGAMLGKIVYDSAEEVDFFDPNAENLVEQVSIQQPVTYGKGSYQIVVVDCGVKFNIIRCLLQHDVTVVRVPWNYDLTDAQYDGVVISNGPGNPRQVKSTIESIHKLLQLSRPVFGICLGHQLMALAAGAEVYKLKYGHRGHNQPVRQSGHNRCFITSQNHGFAVQADSLPEDWLTSYENLNDQSCEGFRHSYKPFLGIQFHPEASGGPTDTEFLFNEFMKMVAFHKGEK